MHAQHSPIARDTTVCNIRFVLENGSYTGTTELVYFYVAGAMSGLDVALVAGTIATYMMF